MVEMSVRGEFNKHPMGAPTPKYKYSSAHIICLPIHSEYVNVAILCTTDAGDSQTSRACRIDSCTRCH